MTQSELRRKFGICRPFVACKKNKDFGFSHKNGICQWDKPDYRYHFFNILLVERIAYFKRRRNGSVIGEKVICLN